MAIPAWVHLALGKPGYAIPVIAYGLIVTAIVALGVIKAYFFPSNVRPDLADEA
jgi:hypothetical protein